MNDPSDAGLNFLFRPRSVAVIGASRNRQSVGGAVFANLLSSGFNGPVYPVNRTASHVQSIRAYTNVTSLPEVPDLMVVAVPASSVLEVIREGSARGVKAAIVLTAGFREIGEKGRVLEQELVRLARSSGMRILGPNCLGAQNPDPNIGLNATFAPTFAPYGNVALASQSGALGLAALDYARDLGIGISVFASLGNKADISGNDVLAQWKNASDTDVILLYLESLGNPSKFREVASEVSRQKPIALVKSGRSGSGARAAGSHTGAMAGPDQSISALCEQTGVIRADTLEELFDVAMVLANQPLPRGRRVGVVTNAGGPGILAADALESYGLSVPRLAATTEQTLRKVLRAEASFANPVDVLADSAPDVYRAALQAVMDDPQIDTVMALYVPPITQEAEAMAQAIVEVAAHAEKPILSCFLGSHGVPAALASLQKKQVPSFRFPEGAARALALAIQYAEWRQKPVSHPAAIPAVPLAAAEILELARARLGPKGGWLNMEESHLWATAWNLPCLPQRRVEGSFDRLEKAAHELGYPVVLKADVKGITHKTEVGAVALDLRNVESLRGAYDRMLSLKPEAFVLQKHLSGGTEWLVGVVRDETYGPMVGVGAGGTTAELWRDTHYRLAPLSEADVSALLERPRIGKTLAGWRGAGPSDVEALKKIIRTLAEAASAQTEISEVELNPVRVMPQGQGAFGLDLRLSLRAM